MKKELKGFICGATATATLICGGAFAAGQWKTIDVLENDITVFVDGKQVTEPNFLYNDKTYLPLRAVAEAVNKPVEYDEATNTAYIGTKPNTPASVLSLTNTYQALKDGIYLYEGNDGRKYVKIKEANSIAFRIDGFEAYGIKADDNDPNIWIYEKYNALSDTRIIIAKGTLFTVDNELYMLADDFINIGF